MESFWRSLFACIITEQKTDSPSLPRQRLLCVTLPAGQPEPAKRPSLQSHKTVCQASQKTLKSQNSLESLNLPEERRGETLAGDPLQKCPDLTCGCHDERK